MESVTILYRRTREEMPAFEEEIKAAIQEGIKLETLVTPIKILSRSGHLSGVECIRNKLGEIDASGRRKPVPAPGTEFAISLDTLIIAISEQPDVSSISPEGEDCLQISKSGTLEVDADTMVCSRPGVFAGGDVVTGPNTVVDAIAAGKKAAIVIDRYLRGEELRQPVTKKLPEDYIEPSMLSDEELDEIRRTEPPRIGAEVRRRNFAEVEMALPKEDARREAMRCLRCDLEFTQPKPEQVEVLITEGKTA